MLNPSTDCRRSPNQSRAQKYANSRWWTDDVKVVGHAIHRPEFDLRDRMVFSVELLNVNGTKTTRWLSVVTYFDGAGCVYDCSGIYNPRAVQFARLERR